MIEKSKLSARFSKKEADKNIVIKKEPGKLKFKKVVSEEKKIEEPVQQPIQESLDLSSDIKKELFEKIYAVPVWFDYSCSEQKELIKSFLTKKSVSGNIGELVEKLYSDVCGFGVLNTLISQKNVSAVFVNGTKSVYIEISGKILNTEIKLNDKELKFILNSILYNAKVKTNKLVLNLKIHDFLVNIVMPEISTDGVNISIRKNIQYNMENFIKSGFVTKELFDFIVSAVKLRKNIIISGDINSGKTTFLEVLLNSVIKYNRIALLENSPQINIESDSLNRFSITKNSDCYLDLISQIIKMSPEYIITDFNKPVCEISDSCGVISTLRASSVEAAMMQLTLGFSALEKLTEKNAKVRALRNYDYIIQINKTSDGLNKITSVVELTPAKTAAQSIKLVAKLKGDEYVTDLPETVTPAISARFVKQN